LPKRVRTQLNAKITGHKAIKPIIFKDLERAAHSKTTFSMKSNMLRESQRDEFYETEHDYFNRTGNTSLLIATFLPFPSFLPLLFPFFVLFLYQSIKTALATILLLPFFIVRPGLDRVGLYFALKWPAYSRSIIQDATSTLSFNRDSSQHLIQPNKSR
jgi:hypothetical protein